ncbi:MAG: PD-(D/E)XK nuclease domain-containing protein, partial [Rhodobacteraceae bacterium]|nr:PD-(D/E)XK nuclease domain-containing protein [Paracoccaceae bacterium]
NWRGETRLYNPFDVLLLLDNREFEPYWFETGSPTFLFETLKARSMSLRELEGRTIDRSRVAKFDVGDIGAEALLFQTGYLTITEEIRKGHRTLFRLDSPNQEVKLSLNDHLLAALTPQDRAPLDDGDTLQSRLEANDFAGFAETLKAYLASIPYAWHNNDLARYEAWSASLLQMCFRAIGVDMRAEEASSHGSADMVVETGGQVFVLEFKMAETDADIETKMAEAFTQMRDRGYANRYRDRDEPIHRIAVVCGREARNLLEVRTEQVNSS